MKFSRSTAIVYHIELTESEGMHLEEELSTLDNVHGLQPNSILQHIFEKLPTVRI